MENVPFHILAKTTRWLVHNGTVSGDGFAFIPLLVQTLVWAAVLLGSVAAIDLTRSNRPQALVVAGVLSVTAIVVGCCGYLAPFSWWQPVIYCQFNGAGQFTWSLNNLFALPWVMGMVGLVAAICARVALNCPTCGAPEISFRNLWLKSTFGSHPCPCCGAKCRVEHPRWYLILGAFSVIGLLGVGCRWAGLTGFLIATSVAIVVDAWFDYRVIHSMGLLKSVSENPGSTTA